MSMKILYVLVSNANDYYAEQAFLSIKSLRLQMPNAHVALLVDNNTAKYIESNFMELKHEIDEYKVINLDSNISNKIKSRILKTTMRQHIDGDFLFIDCDTIICSDLSDIENCGYDIASVLDSHVLVDRHWNQKWIKKNYIKCGFDESEKNNSHFNSGVIFCKDNVQTKKFFSDWASLMHKSIDVGCSIDQAAFNQANVINSGIIKELPGTWNCQLVHGGVKYISNAKIIHYFASIKKFRSPYLLADKNILKDIRNNKKITEHVLLLLKNPRTAIDEKAPLLSPEIPIAIFFHEPFMELVYIYNHFQFLYKFLRCLCMLFGKFHK